MSPIARRGLVLLALLCIALVPVAGRFHAVRASAALPLLRSHDTFVPMPPTGRVTRQQAIVAAIHFAFGQAVTRVPANVTVHAYFGRYSDTLFSHRAVWVVRFGGTGIQIEGDGPPPLPGTPYCPPRVAHEEIVLIDGETGKYLEGTVGIIPTGLPTIVTTPEPTPVPCRAPPAHPISPSTLAVSARGNVFIGGIGGLGNRRIDFGGLVQKRTAAGRFLFAWKNYGSRMHQYVIVRLALDAAGNVYLGNDIDHIQKFSPGGHLIWQWVPSAAADRRATGWSVAVSRDGTVYAAPHEQAAIFVISSVGKTVARWPGRWDSLAVAPDGDVFAGNARRGLIQQFSAAGRRLHSWHMDVHPGIDIVRGVSVDATGQVFVLAIRTGSQTPTYEVDRYSAAGRLLHRFQIAEGPGRGQVIDAWDLTIGPHGTIFIPDRGNPRIERFSPGGTFLGQWQL